MEGCGKPIDSLHSCNVDHIIPQKVFKHLSRDSSRASLNGKEYDRVWNKQPMHHDCNNRRGTGYNRSWSQFACACYFRYFHNRHSFIYALEDCPDGTWGWKAHGFISQVVTHQAYYAPTNIGDVLPENGMTRSVHGLGITGQAKTDPFVVINFPLFTLTRSCYRTHSISLK